MAAGNKQAAAGALIKQAEAYVGFDRWDLLPDPKPPVPDYWRGQRGLQRKLALKLFAELVKRWPASKCSLFWSTTLSRSTKSNPNGVARVRWRLEICQVRNPG